MQILKPTRGIQLNRTHPLARGLMAYWLMNEGSGSKVFDFSGNGNTGTLQGDTHFVPGRFGSALYFDGTGDYVSCGHDSSLHIEKSITVSAWIKHNDWSSWNWVASIARKGDLKSSWELSIVNRKMGLEIWDNADSDRAEYDVQTFDDDKWYHFVGTYDKQYIRLFIDGVEKAAPVSRTSDIGQTGDANVDVTIAARQASGSRNYFPGSVDNVMIFSRALSASEISLLYREPFCMFDQDSKLKVS